MRLDGRDTFADPVPQSGLGLSITQAAVRLRQSVIDQAAATGAPAPAPLTFDATQASSWGTFQPDIVAQAAPAPAPYVAPAPAPYVAPAPAPVDSRASIQPVTSYPEVSPGQMVSPAPAPSPSYAPAPAPSQSGTNPLTQVTDSAGIPIGPVEIDPGSAGYGQLPPTGNAGGAAGGGGGLLWVLMALGAVALGG